MWASPGDNVALFVRRADVRIGREVGKFDAGNHITGINSPK